jgi:hypothetical protein
MKRALAPLLAISVPLAFAACSKQSDEKQVPIADYTAAPVPTAPAQLVLPPSTSHDPVKVLVAWAKAMSLKEWDSAYLYWSDHGAGSGLSAHEFAAKWGKSSNPEFELHPGTTEGAAGSSYYTAPIVLIDGKRHTRGEIVLRRVNDVDGATPEQLRWHIESLTVSP